MIVGAGPRPLPASPARRALLKGAGLALASMPLIFVSRQAPGMTAPALRASLKYQDTPKDEMKCATCLDFIPGKSDTDLGGCKRIPGDSEISPSGYCIVWNT